MRTKRLLPALLLTIVAGCDSTLTVEPTTEVIDERAIVDANSARAALGGVYDGLQDASYYGGDLLFYGDLSSDNAIHTGTFGDFALADANSLRSDNGTIETIWDALYIAIGRANKVIEKVPEVEGLTDEEKNQMVGEALLVRALSHHNLVKFWGDVPVRTSSPEGVGEASEIARSPVAAVYEQILADLDQAEQLMIDESQTRQGSLGAVAALRSRVLLYQGDWAGTIAAANEVLDFGYDLAPQYSDLFSPGGADTPEDIWRVSFTPVEFNNVGFYYISRSFGGRRELAPSPELAATYEVGDARREWSIAFDPSNRRYGSKFPTTEGAEDIHIIRLGEVILNKAEAHARLNQLALAVDEYNKLRSRAGLSEHTLGVEVSTQQQVLDAIWKERQLELAMEGDRWPDLVRRGEADDVLGIPEFQTLYPIPQSELDVAPNLVQNPGY